MLINAQTLDLAFRGFNTVFSDGAAKIEDDAAKIAMMVASGSADETYGWLGMIPNLREWLGPRVVNALKAQGFTIANRKFESTVGVKRESIADDKLGVFRPVFQLMGERSVQHKQELVLGLLKSGFTAICYDGQFFFDTDHPVEIDGVVTTVANTDGGSGTPWFLLDTSKSVRPIIWQEREPYAFQSLTQETDAHVFLNDEYLYGVRARVNAGFGLWQLAWGSKQTLNATNYAAARAAMMNMKSDGGAFLGVKPTLLVVPPALESAARQLLDPEYGTGGVTNEWKGTADLLVTPPHRLRASPDPEGPRAMPALTADRTTRRREGDRRTGPRLRRLRRQRPHLRPCDPHAERHRPPDPRRDRPPDRKEQPPAGSGSRPTLPTTPAAPRARRPCCGASAPSSSTTAPRPMRSPSPTSAASASSWTTTRWQRRTAPPPARCVWPARPSWRTWTLPASRVRFDEGLAPWSSGGRVTPWPPQPFRGPATGACPRRAARQNGCSSSPMA